MSGDRFRLIVMLEDDHDRIDRFARVLSRSSCGLSHWRSAHEFIRSYPKLTETPCLIALDHDLFVDSPNDPDPGDGRDVAAFLATLPPTAPVLIHSTNSIAASSMYFTLQDRGWNVFRIAPIGHDWIESDWLPMVLEIIS